MENLNVAVLFETNVVGEITLCIPKGLVHGTENAERGVFTNNLTGEMIPKTDHVAGMDGVMAYNVVVPFEEVKDGYYDEINQNVYFHDPKVTSSILIARSKDFYNNFYNRYGIVVGKKESVQEHNNRISAYIDSLKDKSYTMSPNEK